MAQHAPGLVSYAVGGFEIGVTSELLPVILIGGQAGEGEQRVGDVARTLGRQEVPVVPTTRAFNERDPALGEPLEGIDLGRVELVANMARDRRHGPTFAHP